MTAEETPWKTIALILVTVLMAGMPGMIYSLRTWGIVDRVDQIQQRQDDVRIRLSVLESQNIQLIAIVNALRVELARHEQESK